MVLRGRKKKSLQHKGIKRVNPQEQFAKEYSSLRPQPLPLPSSHSTNALKPSSSFKMLSASGPLDTSEPLPMPRTLPPSLSTKRNLINFSFEEITSACNNFSPERYVSESLSSVIYRASFWENPAGSRKLDATVTRLHPSNQVLYI